jgi:hypothetical protein
MNYEACLEEGHNVHECNAETAKGVALGVAGMAGAGLGGAVGSLAAGGEALAGAVGGVTLAGVIGAPLAAYGLYCAGQRLAVAPAVAAEKKLQEQQAINAQSLPQAFQELGAIFDGEAPAIESLAAAAKEAGRSAGSRQADIQKALDEGKGELDQLKGMAGNLIASLKARCESAQTKMADLQGLAAKADTYSQVAQDAEWLNAHASDPCTTAAAGQELAAHFQSVQSASPGISQWAADVKAKQAELAALKNAMDADLQTVQQAEALEANVVAAADRVNTLIAAYSSDGDQYRGLRAQFQQRLAALRDKVEHLPDAMPSPLPSGVQTQLDVWRARLKELGDLDVEFNLPPLPTDLQANAAGMRLEAQNQMDSIQAAADACKIDTGDDAVNGADALANNVSGALAAAGDVPGKVAACGQQPNTGTAGTGANAATGFESQGVDEMTVQAPPPSSDSTKQGGTGATTAGTGASTATGFEPGRVDEKTVQAAPPSSDSTKQGGTGATTAGTGASAATGFEPEGVDEKTVQGAPAASSDQSQAGAGKTGFESQDANEKTVGGAPGGVRLIGAEGHDQLHEGSGSSHVMPTVKPVDPGELEGAWFECTAMNQNTTEQRRAQCLATRKGDFARTGQPDRIIQFTKSGNQYTGRFAPNSLIFNKDPFGWSIQYPPGAEVFRLTKTASNRYEGSGYNCYTAPGFPYDPSTNCHWLRGAVISVEGDAAVVGARLFGYTGRMLYVRSTGQSQAPPGQQPVDCDAKYCPVCTQSVSLLGASTPECDACRSQFASQIAQCNQQGSSSGPGHYDTRGLENPPVYCAYAVPQPNFNPNVRYEIGKCNDVHPVEYRKIYGPETFVHCREWLTKMGLAP